MSEPQRIQRKRTRDFRLPENTVCVSRPSLFGNPFIGDREKAIDYFRRWLAGETNFECGPQTGVSLAFIPNWQRRADILAALPSLRGKNLACWCPPGPCHGDVLIDLANR